MCLNTIGQTRAKIDKIDPFVHLATGASLATSLGYYVHPAVPIAMEVSSYAQPAADVATNLANKYWLYGARQQEYKNILIDYSQKVGDSDLVVVEKFTADW